MSSLHDFHVRLKKNLNDRIEKNNKNNKKSFINHAWKCVTSLYVFIMINLVISKEDTESMLFTHYRTKNRINNIIKKNINPNFNSNSKFDVNMKIPLYYIINEVSDMLSEFGRYSMDLLTIAKKGKNGVYGSLYNNHTSIEEILVKTFDISSNKSISLKEILKKVDYNQKLLIPEAIDIIQTLRIKHNIEANSIRTNIQGMNLVQIMIKNVFPNNTKRSEISRKLRNSNMLNSNITGLLNKKMTPLNFLNALKSENINITDSNKIMQWIIEHNSKNTKLERHLPLHEQLLRKPFNMNYQEHNIAENTRYTKLNNNNNQVGNVKKVKRICCVCENGFGIKNYQSKSKCRNCQQFYHTPKCGSGSNAKVCANCVVYTNGFLNGGGKEYVNLTGGGRRLVKTGKLGGRYYIKGGNKVYMK